MGNCGVYRITNTANGKVYIGSSNQIPRRMYLHRWDLGRGKHHSILLQRAWDKYGANSFTFDIVLICADSNLLTYERAILDYYDSANPAKGMNISAVPGRFVRNWTSEERKAHSLQRIGKPLWKCDPIRYAKLMERCVKRGDQHHMFGRHHSDASRAKMSATLKGRVAWNKGLPSPMKGVPRSPETIAKIVATKRARRVMSEAK